MKYFIISVRILAGGLLFAGAIYIWGGLSLDPEGVEYFLTGMPISQAIQSVLAYILVAISGAILGAVVLWLHRKSLIISTIGRKKLTFPLIILLILTVPANWISLGVKGFILAILVMIQNGMGLVGLTLIASQIGAILGDKLKAARFFNAKLSQRGLIVLGLIYFIIVSLVGYSVHKNIPHIGDGVIQLWQARMYAEGKLSVPVPDNIEFFFDPFLVAKDGRWFSQFPPGYALTLVPGLLMGHPELINPILTGLTLILFGLVLKEVGLAYWWVLIFALSPFVLFMSGTFMSHPATMFWGASGLWAFLKSGRVKTGWLFLWGLSAGFMFTTRPYSAICFHLPLFLILLRKKIGIGVLTAGAGAIIGALPVLVINQMTTGSIFTFGYQAAWDGASGLFFTPSQWGPIHTPQLGTLHILTLLQGLNTMLFEIPISALLGVLMWIIFERRKDWKDWGLFWAGITLILAYFFYFYVDNAYGPRFAYCSSVPLLIITALGIRAFYRFLRENGVSRNRTIWSFGIAAIILLLTWGTVSLPARARLYSDRYRDVDLDFIQKIRAEKIDNALVFLDDYPSSDRHSRLYSLGFSNRESWFYAWRLSDKAVEGAMASIGVNPQDGYGPIAPLPVIGTALNRYWGDPSALPHPSEDMVRPHIPLKQGMIFMRPEIEKNSLIFARDFGSHNQVLMNKFPGRNYYNMWRTEEGLCIEQISP